MGQPPAPGGPSPTFPLGVALAVVALDQVTKVMVAATLGPGQPSHRVEILGSVFAIRYVENRGAAFGVLRGQGAVLSLLALAVVAGLVIYYRRVAVHSPSLAIGIGLVGGGAVGNLLDRARLGYVVDFIAVGPWPKFNVADSAITVGVLLLAWRVLLPDQPARVGSSARSTPPKPGLPADG